MNNSPLTEALDAMSYQWLSAQAPELGLRSGRC